MGIRTGAALSCLLLSMLLSSGCAGWRTVSKEEMVREVLGYRPTKVRVISPDSTLEIRDPGIRADSLVGTASRRDRREPVSLALAEIDSAAVPGNHRKITRILAVPVAAAFIAAALALLSDMPGLP
jgi:hypothetical protein